MGLAVPFFPVVGLIIGAVLVCLHMAFQLVDTIVFAGPILTAWVLLTGGIHLDGLADTADAWIGGKGERVLTLNVMKDPHSGPIAIVVIVLIILNKHASLQQILLAGNANILLLLVPVIGRMSILLLLITTPYVRAKGLGAPYSYYLPKATCGFLVLLVSIMTIFSLDWQGVILLGVSFALFILLRCELLNRIGGITGDTLGAACELTETALLLASSMFPAD
jgi:adenosylcobinamide-GDP ribazoletransferase